MHIIDRNRICPPNTLDSQGKFSKFPLKFNQIWYVSYSHKWGVQQHFFFPCPLRALRESNIVKKFQLQSQFQRFFNQTLYVFSQIKDIKHIRTGFSFGCLGHAPEVGLGGAEGDQIRLSRYYLLNNWMKSNQILCVSELLYTWSVQQHIFCHPPPHWGPVEAPRSKGQISLNFNYRVNFSDFLTKLCMSSHK